MTMRDSYLVQRLQQPRTGRLGAMTEAFSFGGGFKNGGLSEEAMELIRPAFSFDYMGAAEFEFGAVPKTLRDMVERRDKLVARFIDFTVDGVNHKIYLICEEEQIPEIANFLTVDFIGKARLKAPTNFRDSLKPTNEWHKDTIGWLELDNGFFYFRDEEAWRRTAALFEVEVL